MAMQLTSQQTEAVFQLWDDLNHFSASETQAAFEYLLQRLAELVDAQHVNWFGSIRMHEHAEKDPLKGWRPIGGYFLKGEEGDNLQAELLQQHRELLESGNIDITITENLKGAGQFRVNAQHKAVPKSWYDSEFYLTMFGKYHIQDVIYAAIPINNSTESWIGLKRCGENKNKFSDSDIVLVELALRPLNWLHTRITLLYGIQAAATPVTAAERRVLEALLTAESENAIADQLELSPNTIRTYCKRICKKLNVRGRSGLQVLWLGK